VADAFFDTNVLVYLLSSDPKKADRAEALMAEGGVISVQVLNEFVSVARRKLGVPWPDLHDILGVLRAALRVEPITLATHDRALEIAARYKLGIYDALILSAALLAECETVYSEDLQHGQRIAGALRIRNPFRSARA
jgi:predicted nucleic acid-binding protein